MDGKGIKGLVMTDVPMKRYTSMKVGGPAKLLLYPADEPDLAVMLGKLAEAGITPRFLGNGTNVIVSDDGIDEALIRLTRMRHLRFRKEGSRVSAEVSGGIGLGRFIREHAKRGLKGLERLFGIPGTIGGAVKMNAGSFGASISDTLTDITVADKEGKVRTVEKKDGEYAYRQSPVAPSECVVSARFLFTPGDKAKIVGDMEHLYEERRRRHPMEYPSAGSVFKAVAGEPAWKFIEKAGLKGATDRRGGQSRRNMRISLSTLDRHGQRI